MYRALVSLILWFSLCACSDTSFSGSAADKTAPTKPEPAKVIPQNANAAVEPTAAKPLDATPALPPSPVGAVTKGSFTVWAVPSNPQPGQDYAIHINVRLPSGATNYTYADLSGRVQGSDNYFRGIGRESHGAMDPAYIATIKSIYPGAVVPSNNLPQDQFSAADGYATVVLYVPGGERMVRDSVTVASSLLNESQQIDIVFGS